MTMDPLSQGHLPDVHNGQKEKPPPDKSEVDQKLEKTILNTPSEPSKPSLKWLSKELKQKTDQKNLFNIGKEQAKSATSSEAKYPLKASSLAESVNPVGKVDTNTYIPKTALQTTLNPNLKEIENSLDKIAKEMKGPPTKLRIKKYHVEELRKEIRKIYNSNAKDKFGDTQKLVRSTIENLRPDPKFEAEPIHIIHDLEKFESSFKSTSIPSEELKKVPVQYSKDQIINQLRIKLANGEDSPEIYDFIKELNQNPDAFINKSTLEAKRETLPEGQPLAKALDEMTAPPAARLVPLLSQGSASSELKFVEPNLTEFVTSYDLLTHFGNEYMMKLRLETLEDKFKDQAYVAKLGLENTREVFGFDILEDLGLDTFYAQKTNVSLPDTKIGESAGNKAIASKFIDAIPIAKEDGKWRSTWEDFLKTKKDLALATHLNYPEEEVFELQIKYNELADDLKQLGGQKSIPEIFLVSALLGGFDDHIGQIFEKNGEMINIDFSRYLAPSMVLKNGNRTFFTFRSAFYDHPFVDERLPPHLIAKIRGWDVGKIADQLKAKTGNLDEFQKDRNRLHGFIVDINKATREDWSIREFEDLCDKYDVDFFPNQTKQELTTALQEKMLSEKVAMQEKWFNKIHPKASEELIQRLNDLKEYVDNTKRPTAKGAFAVMHSNIMPFMEVLGRYETSPGEKISHDLRPPVKLRALEDIISAAENLKTAAGERIATPEEIAELKEKKDILRAQGANSFEVMFTMNLLI